MGNVNGARVRIARVFRGKTQADLAIEVGASTARIGQVEAGRQPSASLLEAIGVVLGFEPDFFVGPIHDEFTEQECHFRRQTTTPEKVRKRILARGTLFGMVVEYLRKRLTLPAYSVPQIAVTDEESIERAAAECRRQLRLGTEGPVLHMGRALEHAGVVVARLDAESQQLDAFSRPGRNEGVSMVVLNAAKGNTSRARYDMAHELGHLVMHHESELPLKDKERQANRFAGAFLLPRETFRREFWAGGQVDWNRLFTLKQRWMVSVQAMLYRAYDLKLIDVVQLRRSYKILSARGWLRQEPGESHPEMPELLQASLQALGERRKEGVPEIAKALRWNVQTFYDVTGIGGVRAVAVPEGADVLSLNKFKRRAGTASNN